MRSFTIGGVLGRMLAIFQGHPGRLVLLGLVLGGLPDVIEFALLVSGTGGLRPSGASGVSNILNVICGAALQIAVVRTALGDSAGSGATGFGSRPGASAGPVAGSRSGFPLGRLVRIQIVSGLGIAVAALLLIVPGLMLACRWAVAAPAAIAEDAGFSDAFRRSTWLTDGYRWPILGVLVIVVLAILAASFALGALGALLDDALQTVWILPVVTLVASALAALLLTLSLTALYFDLRAEREGETTGALASLFE